MSRDAGVPRISLEILSIVGAAALVVAAGRAVAGASPSLALPRLLDAGCILVLAGPLVAWRLRASARQAQGRGATSDEESLFDTAFRGQAEAELAASLVVTSALARAVDVREAAAAVNETLVRRTGLDRTAVLLYQEDGVCRFVGWQGLSAEYRRAVEGHCPWREGTSDAEPIVVDDVAKDPTLDPYLELFEREDIATLAFVPIVARGGVVGKLMLYGREPGSITGAAVRKAHLVAVSLGTAVARLRMADALSRSESRLRAMIDNVLDAVVSMDGRGIVTAWNGQAQATFGWTDDEAVGRPLHELIIPEELRDEHCRGLAHFAKTGEGPALGKRLQLPAVRKNGTRMSVELSITPLRIGDEVSFTGFLRDITESERAADELIEARAAAEAANRAKSEFLANMSHEIRTPLTSILGYADLLREPGELEPGRRQQTIDTIQAAGQHLLTVINDILDISKIEAGKMTVEAVETPLVEILQTIGELLRPRAAEKGVAFEIRLETPLPERIVGDPTRLRQILMNLAGNATKFTTTGSVVIAARVDVGLGPQRLTIDVEDTGPGLSQVHAARLFRPFGQADASVTRRHGGTGLGLTISHRLARLLGGSVSILRTELGKGSCFRLELPLVPAPGAAWVDELTSTRSRASRAVEALPAPHALPGRILLAEDGRDNQFLIAFHLRRAGAEVEVAHNGRVALETLEREAAAGRPFDLLLTDIQMPEMDGYTLTCMLRQRGNRIPIVALTAHAMLEDRQRCFDAGCDDYVGKPIDKARLITTCARWLGVRRASETHAA